MRVLLVGGSPEPASASTIRSAAEGCDAVVAVDRGLDALVAAGLTCDLFCGDADSVSAAGASVVSAAPPFDVVRYDPHKDATDLELALDEVSRRWLHADVRATCVSGGNPDHALGVLGRLTAWQGRVEVHEDRFMQRLLRTGETWKLSGHLDERFSFIPLSMQAVVSERGMRWKLDHACVPLLSDLGISNVVDADPASITCHDGALSAWAFKGYFAGA